jgi:guanine deaminase
MKRARQEPLRKLAGVVKTAGAPAAYRGKILTPLSAPSPAPSSAARAPSPGNGNGNGSGNGKARAPLLYIEDGLLTVSAAGRIEAVAPFDRSLFRGPVLDLRPCVLLPGLIDAHTHFPQTRITGSASGPLLEWLAETVFPEEARFLDDAYARAVADEFIDRMLVSGTTTCAAFSSSSPQATHILFEALARSGMRAVAGLTLMDQECPEAIRLGHDAAIAACEELIDRFHGYDGGRLSFAITPRFAPSCSRRLMEAAARLASDRALHVQTHIAENLAEGSVALAAHPYARDYLGVYEKVGLVTGRTLLAHAIHLSPSEWDRIAQGRASVVHCPDSNFFLGSGRMRLSEPRSRGVPVALGTDIAAGRTFNMRRAIASAYDNALCVGERASPEELFRMATLGGAEALGMAAAVGSLEEGKEADFIAVRVPPYAQSGAEVIAQIAFSSDVTLVERAFVRGRQIACRLA